MKYQKVYYNTIVDGPGVRVSLYVSGCTHRCKGCHNPDGWSFDNGTEFSEFTVAEILDALAKPYIKGLSLLGGEPFDQSDLYWLVNLVRLAKEHYPNKDIWIWTGYNWDQIKSSPLTKFVDVVVTGKFIYDQRDISDDNRWRGSRNQRVIDVQATLSSGKLTPIQGIPNNEV